jgi:hypothetical protein
MDTSRLNIVKFGEIINKKNIPLGIASDNINGPVVFKRPNFYPSGSEWIMYFGHHNGDGIRVAESEDLFRWRVLDRVILHVNETPGYGHVASPEVVVLNDHLELYYHCKYKDFQYTFKAITQDGQNWEYDREVQGCFYFRLIGSSYAIAKYKNNGGIWYKKTNDKFVERGRLLPRMRHCCYCDGVLYWSEIGDMPEVIYRGRLNLIDFTISNKEKIVIPSESYEITDLLKPSQPGASVGVTEVRDPYVVQNDGRTFIYYTVRGEEAIAFAEVLD